MSPVRVPNAAANTATWSTLPDRAHPTSTSVSITTPRGQLVSYVPSWDMMWAAMASAAHPTSRWMFSTNDAKVVAMA
jgi:hypothetical protein